MINFEEFENQKPYPTRPIYTAQLEKYKAEMIEWRKACEEYKKEDGTLFAKAKQAILEEYGIADNPKAEKVWNLAWEDGHAYGYIEVANYVYKYADLVK